MEIIAIDSDNHTVHCVSKVESFFMLRQVVHLITTNKMMGKYQQIFTSFRERCVGVVD